MSVRLFASSSNNNNNKVTLRLKKISKYKEKKSLDRGQSIIQTL